MTIYALSVIKYGEEYRYYCNPKEKFTVPNYEPQEKQISLSLANYHPEQ